MFTAIFGSMIVLASFVGLLAAIRLLDALLRYNGCDAIGGWLEAHGLGYKRRLRVKVVCRSEYNGKIKYVPAYETIIVGRD